jgi:hypothetical protein
MADNNFPIRLAGARMGMRPDEVGRLVSNPRELTARLRYQQAFPRS